MPRWVRAALCGALGWLYPQGNRCLCCSRVLLRGRLLCPRCEAELEACRARPMSPEERAEVAELVWAEAPYRYAGVARLLVRRLKYNGACLAALPLAEAMAPLLTPARWDVLAPVPLSRARRGRRGYNQAGLLCAQVARATGLPMAERALVRVRDGRSQVGRTRAQRLTALDGAFVADPALVAGMRVLLVDDVCTTGATAAVCAAALWRADAVEVGLLTACRTLKDSAGDFAPY